MNSVALVGRPTKDPELRYTPGGVPVCTFILAVDREFKNREGKREADFVFVRVWNRAAEHVADYVTKGRLISVRGRILTETFQEKDGSRKFWTEVVAENVGFLGPRKDDRDGFTPVEGVEENPFYE